MSFVALLTEQNGQKIIEQMLIDERNMHIKKSELYLNQWLIKLGFSLNVADIQTYGHVVIRTNGRTTVITEQLRYKKNQNDRNE